VPGLGEDSRLFLLAAVFVMSIGSISRTSSQSSAMPQRAPRALFGMACSIRKGVGICTRGHTERLERDERALWCFVLPGVERSSIWEHGCSQGRHVEEAREIGFFLFVLCEYYDHGNWALCRAANARH
jgi:hypothetical protein